MNRFELGRLALCIGVLLLCIREASALEVTLSGDAHVNATHASINYGTLSNLYVGNGNTAFLQFDLTTLPSGTASSQVSRATLTVFVNRVNVAGSVTVAPVTAAWGEYSVTATAAPSVGGSIANFPVTISGQFISVDVTAQVQAWVNSPGSNNGLALSSGAANALFDSKENDETGHSARLDVTLVSQGPQGVAGVQGPVGSTGAAGVPGPVGPTGPIGPVGPAGVAGAGLIYRNAYVAGTQYALNDSVTFNGSTYISLQDGNIGNSPDTHTAFWSILAAAGATGQTGPQGVQGTQGPIGAVGPQGIQGNQGATGATGAQGPIGPAGAIGATGAAGPAGPTGATGTFSFASDYSSTTAYTLGQVVFCSTTCSTNGSSYISLVSGGNQGFDPPTSNAKWGLVAKAGATGPVGAAGATGASGPMGPSGPTGPTGAAGPAGPAGSAGLTLKDRNGVSQGYLIGYDNYFYFTVENSGYFYQVGVDGTFFIGQIYWTGANCTGTPYLNDGVSGGATTFAKQVTYSAAANSLYILANPNAGGISTSVQITAGSIENPTCMPAGYAAGGWAMTPISPATIGSTASGTPLKTPAPFLLP